MDGSAGSECVDVVVRGSAAGGQELRKKYDAGLSQQGAHSVAESVVACGGGSAAQVSEGWPDLCDGVDGTRDVEGGEVGERVYEGSRVPAGRGCLKWGMIVVLLNLCGSGRS